MVEPESAFIRDLDNHNAQLDPPADEPLKAIRLHESWYELVSPVLPDGILPDALFRGGKNQTAYERLLELMYFSDSLHFRGDQRRTFQSVLANAFADAVSRSGSFLNADTSWLIADVTPRKSGFYDFTESQARKLIRLGDPVQTMNKPAILEGYDTTEIMMRAIFTGYVLSSSTSWFSWFCIAILLARAFLALYHSILVVFFKQQSSNA